MGMESRFISTLGPFVRIKRYSVCVLGEIISLHRKYPLLMHVWQTSEFPATCSCMFLYLPCTSNMLNNMYIFMLNTSTSYLGHILCSIGAHSCVVKINNMHKVGLRLISSNYIVFRLPYRRSRTPSKIDTFTAVSVRSTPSWQLSSAKAPKLFSIKCNLSSARLFRFGYTELQQ